MERAMTAWETVQAFCRALFEKRDAEETCQFLADDFCFVGTGENEFARDRREMDEYLRQDMREMPEPFSVDLTLFQEQKIDAAVCNLSVEMTLENIEYRWRVRGFFSLLDTVEGWRLCTIRFSESGANQQGEEHYPATLIIERLARQRQELLNDSLPGGMMGGYIEEGFPFYFINNRMLEYLGYTSEEEFVTDIDGMISNCMHPDDRAIVDAEVALQMAECGEYVVEYRMKKQDGSYLWIHDIGREVTAENGKLAILSVCMDITAQKRAQSEILHLYNNVPGAVFRCRYDEGFSVVDANDGLYEFLGYTREEFMARGNQMADVVYPGDLNIMKEKLTVDAGRGETIQDEHRIVCKDGSIKWISMKAQIMPGDDGKNYFYGVFVDITDEKQAQEQIRELYEKELAYFAQAASAEGSIQGRANVTRNRIESYQSTVDAVIIQAGDTYVQMVEELAASAEDADYGEYLRQTLERTQLLSDFATGKTSLDFEFLRRQKGGEAFWNRTNFRLHQNPESGDIIAFFYTIDITEQKIQEQLLSKVTELDYELISDVDIRNNTYHIASAHPGADKMMEPEGEFLATARNIASAYMEEAAGQEYLARLNPDYMRRELDEKGSYTFMMETQEEYGTRVKRYQIFYINKELGRVCIARSDVTDIIRQEQQQKEALAAALTAAKQANAAKTDFLSRMSHEIRTPMNAIIGMSAIAGQSIGDNEHVADCIAKIEASSRFLLALINDILDMSRIESGKMLLKSDKIVIRDFLNGLNAICHSQAAAKGVSYECIAEPGLAGCYLGDEMRLQQVLLNILANAIKFTDEGGKVTFTVARKDSSESAELRFVVTDTGIGIREDFLEKMFEPFTQESSGTTAQYGGTGLGLAISKNIIDMMEGSITVRSVKGKGSQFTVDVPLGLTEDRLETRPEPRAWDFSGRRILIVEDNTINTEVAAMLLECKGFAVETAVNGQQGVEKFEKSEAGFYDAILMDIRMPLMDGLTAAKTIRQMGNADAEIIPIIAMTANAFDEDIEKSREVGMNKHLTKPIEPERLYQVLHDCIKEREESSNVWQ